MVVNSNGGRVALKGRSIMLFVVLSFSITWSLQLALAVLPGGRLLIGLAAFGPTIAAAIASAQQGGAEFRIWIRSYLEWRIDVRSLFGALVIIPTAFLLLTLMYLNAYHPEISDRAIGTAGYIWFIPRAITGALPMALLTLAPMGEEGGWRGFLTPRAVERWGEAGGSAFVGLIWAAWHLESILFSSDWRFNTPILFYIPVFVLTTIPLSYIMTVVRNRSMGSVLPCIWLHGLANLIYGTALSGGWWGGRPGGAAHAMIFMSSFWIAAAVIFLFNYRRAEPSHSMKAKLGDGSARVL